MLYTAIASGVHKISGQRIWGSFYKNALYKFTVIIIIRSTSKSRPNNIRGGKCPSVRPSVRPYVRPSVHKKFLRFQWNLVYR